MTEADTKRLAEIRARVVEYGPFVHWTHDATWLLDLVARLQELIDRAECPECGMDARERDIQNTLAAAGSERVMDNWNRIAAEQRIAKLEAALTEIAESDHNSKATTVAHEALEKP